MNTLDIVTLSGVLVVTLAYFTKGELWSRLLALVTGGKAGGSGGGKAGAAAAPETRDIAEKMQASGKNAVFFFASQTGTAEDFASRLAKEGHSRFGLNALLADPEDYDFESLDKLPADCVAGFVLATYGEGEPPDNAAEFHSFLTDENVSFSGEGPGAEDETRPLANLQYVAFGLGNRTYEHYNAMVRSVDRALTRLGARRIGDAGEGDDGDGNLEEDFLAWKESMWRALADKMGLEEREATYEPILEVVEMADVDASSSATVYLGEPNKRYLNGDNAGPFNAHNPYIAPVTLSKELFKLGSRNCLHMELDMSGSNLTYKTGDHLAVWPMNANEQVNRLLDVLDLADKKSTVFRIKPLDATAKIPIPQPTTYEVALRYYLEIAGPVSRQFLASLAEFAPSDNIKREIALLGNDKDLFHEKVAAKYATLAQVLTAFAPKWPSIPFSIILEGIPHLQPRYYSISSSSLAQGNKHPSITAVVESHTITGHDDSFNGVTTNYLLAVQNRVNGVAAAHAVGSTYEVDGPRGLYHDGHCLAVHTRRSNFRLPDDDDTPIVMVGPGTGVAPFRGFVQERAAKAQKGNHMGKTVLFFGCRSRKDDFMYEEEWAKAQSDMGEAFEMHTAFSRDGPEKVYVQNLLAQPEIAQHVVDLLVRQKGQFYICGDAVNMAHAVQKTLVDIIDKYGEGASGEEFVKRMRATGLYQEDVWS